MSTYTGVMRIESLVPSELRALQGRKPLLPRTSVIAAAASALHQHVFPSIGRAIADVLIAIIRRRAKKVAKHAVILEGIKAYLLKDLVEHAVPPPADLREQLRELLIINRDTAAELRAGAAAIRNVNPPSRVANEFESVCAVLDDLHGSVTFILELTEEGAAHAPVLERLRVLDASIDAKIERYMDDEDFDPDLLALAEQAIGRIQAESKSAAARN